MKMKIAVTALVFAAALLFSCPSGSGNPEPVIPPVDTKPTAYKNIGVYVWDRNPEGNNYFAQWIGLDVNYAEDYMDRAGGWSGITGDNYGRASAWSGWKNEKPERRLVLSVPPFPDSVAGDGVQAYQDAADGKFDQYYQTFGQMLINNRLEDTILRFGHEMNGDWYSYSITTGTTAAIRQAKQENYKLAFQEFVKTLRALDGQKFEFCWNPNCASDNNPLIRSYPGNDYVDYIGFDQYDHTLSQYDLAYYNSTDLINRKTIQTRAWNSMVTMRAGMNWFASFAKEQGKPLVIAEWGLWEQAYNNGSVSQDGGDNPYYIQKMYDFINANEVAWHIYFMFASDGDHSLWATNKFPHAIDTFLGLWRPTDAPPALPAIAPDTLMADGYDPATLMMASKARMGGSVWLLGDPWAYSDYTYINSAAGTKGNLAAVYVRSDGYNADTSLAFDNCPESYGFAAVYQFSDRDANKVGCSLYVNGSKTAVSLPNLGNNGWGNAYYTYEFDTYIPRGATIEFRGDMADIKNNTSYTSLNFDYIIFK
ncbi:MAG: glycoside hydrolase family 26 protein [Treponema sp.]|nr:glycoside hydrolase family 26 protein [Treponema sp.]